MTDYDGEQFFKMPDEDEDLEDYESYISAVGAKRRK